MKLIRKMTREEMWEEFESQLKCEVRTPITMSYNESIKLAEMGIKDVVARWKKRLEQAFFGRWIPVSEGLPEESDYCLCCDKDGYMTIGYISKYSKEWCFDDEEVDIDVAAWMPLPAPYRIESEEKNDLENTYNP